VARLRGLLGALGAERKEDENPAHPAVALVRRSNRRYCAAARLLALRRVPNFPATEKFSDRRSRYRTLRDRRFLRHLGPLAFGNELERDTLPEGRTRARYYGTLPLCAASHLYRCAAGVARYGNGSRITRVDRICIAVRHLRLPRRCRRATHGGGIPKRLPRLST